MELWIISQITNKDYDTYDSAVVAAPTAEAARSITPCYVGNVDDQWAAPEHIRVEHIGTAKAGAEQGLILGSFNAG